jgi:hypothetical protein
LSWLHPKEKFDDTIHTVVGRVDSCRSAHNARMASESRLADPYVRSLTLRNTCGHVAIPTPRIRTHAAPSANGPGGICDVGDNPMIC